MVNLGIMGDTKKLRQTVFSLTLEIRTQVIANNRVSEAAEMTERVKAPAVSQARQPEFNPRDLHGEKRERL